MSTTSERTGPRVRLALLIPVFAALLLVVVGAALALDRWGPGDMGRGFAVGGAVGGALGAFAIWRGLRRPERATPGDRLFAQTADERDHALAGRALAVLGAAALPLTAAATVAIVLGVQADATLFLTLVAMVAVLVGAFVRAARRA